MKIIEINGQDFSDLDGFYKSLEKFLHAGDCPWGQNLDSLDEIVYCNFNYTDNKENDVTKFIWDNYAKSRVDLKAEKNGRPIIEFLDEILVSNPKIQFVKK